MGKHAQSIEIKALRRIRGRGRGTVFTPSHFYDLGSRAAIDKLLSRLTQAGTIRKLARGLYDYPKDHPRFGMLSPTVEAIVKAIADRDARRLQPSGAYAANILGLSEQVPMRVVLLTDGRSSRVKIGKREIILKHTTLRNMAVHERSGLVIQALRHLGHRNIDDTLLRKLDTILTSTDKKRLSKDLQFAPAWIASALKEVVKQGV